MSQLLHRARDTAAAAGGLLLGGATRAVSAVRPARKPLHPEGQVSRATLRRSGVESPTGVPWLDEPGEDDVLVRRSRAVGLPAPLPDIHGLAVRVPTAQGGHGDLLLASTGLGRLTRFLLTGGRQPTSRPMTTLLPYRTAHGPLLLAAVPQSPDLFVLCCASPTGAWQRFGTLSVVSVVSVVSVAGDARAEGDALVSFDPVRNAVPGLETYGWVRRLREPAYATARHSR